MKVEEDIECPYCEEEFFIQYNEGSKVCVCPFCGEALEDETDEDEDVLILR